MLVSIGVLLAFLPLVAQNAPDQRSRPARPLAPAITFVGMFHSPSDVRDARTPCQRLRDYFDSSGKSHDVARERPAVCDKVLDVVAGPTAADAWRADPALSPVKIGTDSRGRILISDPNKSTIHVFDFFNRKYTPIHGSESERILRPYGVSSDDDNNIYVSDLQLGVVAKFDESGKFQKYVGQFKGERGFELPNCIAIDKPSGRLYVVDKGRHFVLVFDRDGKRLASIGKRGGGSGPAEFSTPTELALHDAEVYVFDKNNRRIQVLDLEGKYKREIQLEALGTESPKGMAIDSHGFLYMLIDVGLIEVFDPAGLPVYQFGRYGTGEGEFRDPAGIYIDSADRLYVSDTGNERVQVFQIAAR